MHIKQTTSSMLRKISMAILPLFAVAGLVLSVQATYAQSTVVVSSDTAAGENQPGWLFNRDTSTSTPYEFNSNLASIGSGSLYVEPIGSTNRFDKFIAENFVGTPVSNFNSVSYDFAMSGYVQPDSAKQFYMNIYANKSGSPQNKFYDCRFDYVPTTGSIGAFTTVTIDATDPADNVRVGTGNTSCPNKLSGMTNGYVRMFSISVGDTSFNDSGLAGYLDNVVVNLDSGVTNYDFDPRPATSDDCKSGAWMRFGAMFNSQGACVSYVNHNDGNGNDDNKARGHN